MVFLWKHCGNGSWTRFMMAIIPGTANSYLSSTIYLRVEITFLHAFFCAFDDLLNAFYGRLCIKTSLLYKQRNRSIEMSIFHWLFYFTVYFNCPKQIDHKHIKSHILLSCTHTRPVVSERRNSKYVWYDSCERQRYLAMLLRQMVFFFVGPVFLDQSKYWSQVFVLEIDYLPLKQISNRNRWDWQWDENMNAFHNFTTLD